jgi:hypothetical protein
VRLDGQSIAAVPAGTHRLILPVVREEILAGAEPKPSAPGQRSAIIGT